MLKQFVSLLFLSVLVIFFSPYIVAVLQVIANIQFWLMNFITSIFPATVNVAASTLISRTLTLTIFPLVIAMIPALLYFLSKQDEMPHLYSTIWISWILSSLIFILHM